VDATDPGDKGIGTRFGRCVIAAPLLSINEWAPAAMHVSFLRIKESSHHHECHDESPSDVDVPIRWFVVK
jgi:hypothetical protein